MKFITITSAALTLLTACSAPSPEVRAARNADAAQLAQTVSSRMMAPATVAFGECLRQIETGNFSEATLLGAGFQKGSVLGAGAYYINVSDPIKQGLSERSLTFGVNIGSSASVNFGSGCKIMLPNRGNADIPFLLASQRAATANGYSASSTGRGALTIQKGDFKIRTTIKRTIRNGGSSVGGFIRAAK